MIWATVSSRSCFCRLCRASPSLTARNIINLISVLTIWWSPCVKSSIVLLEEDVCYDQCVLLAKHCWPLVQFSSVSQLCPTLCNPMNCSMPGLPVHHQLPEFIQTHAHWVSDATQPSHPLSSPSPPAPSPSQHQGLFQWVNSSHEVAKVLEFQLQHQSF